MAVNELLELLKSYSPNLRVVVNGYEDGYDDLSPEQLSQIKIILNVGKHKWEEIHGAPISLVNSALDGPEIVDALVLRRASH